MHDIISFEAEYLRAAVLVGVVHERDVPMWADAQLSPRVRYASELADILLAPVELTAIREALRPLVAVPDERRAARALLNAIALDHIATNRSAHDTLRVLSHVRREGALDDATASAIKEFEDRQNMASVNMRGVSEPTIDEIATWLDSVREPACYRFAFADRGEAAAFVAAVSRKMDRDRRVSSLPPDRASRAWLLESRSQEIVVGETVVLLNESAWLIVMREFAPVPIASRIPHAIPSDGLLVLLDEATAQPFSAEQVRRAFVE